jgi:hypothetical protein
LANSEPRIDVRATTSSPRGQREEHDEELRQVAERRLQRPGDRRAEPLADRLGRDRDRPGEAAERGARDQEHGHRLDVREVEDRGDHGQAEDAREDEDVPAHAGTLPTAQRGRPARTRAVALREHAATPADAVRSTTIAASRVTPAN